jgi:hypothetical protein
MMRSQSALRMEMALVLLLSMASISFKISGLTESKANDLKQRNSGVQAFIIILMIAIAATTWTWTTRSKISAAIRKGASFFWEMALRS